MFKKIIDKYNGFSVQVRATFCFFICACLQRGIIIITTPIFTRLMTAEEYGSYNVFNSWMGIISVFVSFKLCAGGYTQGIVKFSDEREKYASSLQGLTTVLVCSWMAIYFMFQDFWNGLFSVNIIQMLAMFVMIWSGSIFTFWSIDQRVDYKYRILVTVTLTFSVVQPIIGVFAVTYAHDKVTARILSMAFVQLLFYSPFFVMQLKKNHMFYCGYYWIYAIRYNFPLLPHYLSSVVLNNSDRIMIAKMVGADEAGIYSLAYSVSLVMIILNQALLQTIEPWLYKRIKEGKISDIGKITYPCFLLVALGNLMVIMFAPEVVAIFAPSEYYDAIWMIPPIAMSVFFMFSFTFFAVFEFYFERTRYITLATMIGAVANILLNYIFIQIYGYYVAGYTTLLCYILYAVFHFIFMRKICKKQFGNVQPYSIKQYWGLAAVFIVAGLGCLITYYNTVVRYAVIAIMLLFLIIMRKRILMQGKKWIRLKY